jgi:hypothetical protein
MTLQERKLHLINQLVHTSSEKFIRQIEELLKKSFADEYGKKIKPMSEKELIKRAYRSEEDIQAGRLVVHEDVVTYFKNKKRK